MRKWVAGAVVVACAMVLCVSTMRGTASADDDEAAAARAPRTRALLIGCSEYPNMRKVLVERGMEEQYEKRVFLRGSPNDVATWRTTLISLLGAQPGDIRTLVGWPLEEDRAAQRPTRDNILRELRRLADVARPGDLVLVTFSGHGVQVTDDDADEEPDGYDEAWAPADARYHPKERFAGVIRDDEIGAHLRAIRDKGAIAWLVMDCCHSSTGMRAIGDADEDTVTRAMEPEDFGLEVAEVAGATTRSGLGGFEPGAMSTSAESLDGVVAMYAAQTDQLVPEVWLPSKRAPNRTRNGLLTTALTRALHRGGTHQTFRELFTQARAAYPRLRGSHIVDPSAEGMLERYVSGDAAGQRPPLMMTRVGERLELSAGGMRGLEAGTELSVYGPGHRANDSARIGFVVVTAVEPTRAWCRPLDGTSTAWVQGEVRAWPVELYRYMLSDWALRVAVVDPQGRPLQGDAIPADVRDVFRDDPVCFPLAARPAEAHWVVTVPPGGAELTLAPTLQTGASPRFRRQPHDLETALRQVFRARNLLRLPDHAGIAGLPSRFGIDAFTVEPGGTERPIRPGGHVSPGERIGFRLHNRLDFDDDTDPDQPFDVFAFWVDPHYGIVRLFPRAKGESPRIISKDRKPRKLRTFTVSDEGVGVENLIVLAMPQHRDAPDLDLHFLAQPPQELAELGAREVGSDDPRVALFEALGSGIGTRSGASFGGSIDELAVGSFSWTTRWGSFRVPSATAGAPAVVLAPATPRDPSAGAPPDAWTFGPNVRLAQVEGAWCVLIAEGDGAQQMLIDVDGGVPLERQNAAGLRAMVQSRSFGADLAIRLQPGRRTVWYDTDGDGSFDTVFEDVDRDPAADVVHTRTATRWTTQRDVEVRLLNTTRLQHVRGKALGVALRRLRALTQ